MSKGTPDLPVCPKMSTLGFSSARTYISVVRAIVAPSANIGACTLAIR